MNWLLNLVSPTSSDTYTKTYTNARKDIPWISPKKTYPCETVSFDEARKEANENFFNNIKIANEEIKAKK